jgi:ubiquinone/menaquinone biosynthesis C-methylase UbiE
VGRQTERAQTVITPNEDLKEDVRSFWSRQSCGEVYTGDGSIRHQLEKQAIARFELEPYLSHFARFNEGKDKDVLEIGVGMGADHLEWARSSPRSLTGVDITSRAVAFTRERLQLYSMESNVLLADAERLPFHNDSFDLIYSWGVLHHTPDTPAAIDEVWRVLRPGGIARIMIYHTASMVGYMLWMRYAMLRGKPWRTLSDIYAKHLESPGTKAYSIEETRRMFSKFEKSQVRSQLSFGDLLLGEVGQRHRGIVLATARKLWPRPFIRQFMAGHGLYVLIEAVK